MCGEDGDVRRWREGMRGEGRWKDVIRGEGGCGKWREGWKEVMRGGRMGM